MLAHDFRSVCLYHSIHDEMYRSFAPEGNLMMTWSHLGEALDNPQGCRSRIWRDLLTHCGGSPVYGGRYTNVFFPDYRPKPGIVAYAEELAAIRNGLGRLILGARLNDSAAAVFYSPACYRARIVAMKDNEHYHAGDEQNGLLASLSAALGDLRIGWRFIAYEQVARGELDPRTTKALFLWGALAFSSSESAAIRRYLDDGGVVVADSEPGLYDEHCHKRATGSLHDCLPPEGGDVRTVGKGRFILYRGLDSRFADTRGYGVNGQANSPATEATLRSLSKFSTALARQVGLEPNFRIRAGSGEQGAGSPEFSYSPLPAPRSPLLEPSVAAVELVNGPAHYVACVIDGKEGQTFEVHLSLSGSGHVYDCRAGKYLGPAGERTVELRASNRQSLRPLAVSG